VLILTRNASIGHLNTVTVAAITGTIRGVASEVVLDVDHGRKARCAVNLHQIATLSQDRLGKRVAGLSDSRMQEICAALRFATACT
jgi:mRNA interferase MazF